MGDRNRRVALLLTMSLIAASMAGCGKNQDAAAGTTAETGTTTEASTSETAASDTIEGISVEYKEEDLDTKWEDTDTSIICEETSATVTGEGAAWEDGILTISAAGTYVISGTLTDGQIVVNAGKEDVVHLVLNGAALHCEDGAPIYGIQSDKLVITMAEGSTNHLTDGADYALEEDGTEEDDSVIYSKDDLTINGSGILEITGNYKHGIHSKDDLIILDSKVTVTAAADGIKGKDSVVCKDAVITVQAANDGIQSNNDTDTTKGYIVMDGGTYTITAATDGIQAETVLQILDGTYEIISGGGSESVSNAGSDLSGSAGNQMPQEKMQQTQEQTQTEDTESTKGLKAGTGLLIQGGSVTIDSADDAVHGNGNVCISEGTLTLATGDDGIHADAQLTINGGTIQVIKSYEGLEGSAVVINGGTVHVTASDDGINAAGGDDSSQSMGVREMDTFSRNSDTFIRITNGYVWVSAAGDGLDTNGSLYIDGGTVLIIGPTSSGDGSLDYDGEAVITGGTFIAAGSAGMVQTFADTSSQNSFLYCYDEMQTAGTMIHVSDASENAILSFAPEKDYQAVLISAPDLQIDSSYVLSSGGSAAGETKDGYYAKADYQEGTVVETITLDSVVTQSGTTAGGSGMKGAGQGGMGGKGQDRGSVNGDNAKRPEEIPEPETAQ